MSTNQLTRKKKKSSKKEAPPLFVPGCVQCGQVHMSLTCLTPVSGVITKEPSTGKVEKKNEKGIESQDANNNGSPRNRNGMARRGRGGGLGGGQRSRDQRPPGQQESLSNNQMSKGFGRVAETRIRGQRPPPSFLQPNYMNNNNYQSSTFQQRPPPSSYRNHHQNPPSSINRNRNDSRQNTRRPPTNFYREARRTVPPNEKHMEWLNDQLRMFSYGTDDMYQEMTLPTPPQTPPKSKTLPPESTKKSTKPPAQKMESLPPRDVFNTMLMHRKIVTTDEKGVSKTEKETRIYTVDQKGIVFVDLAEDLLLV